MDLLGERTMKSKFKEYFILNIKFVKKELLYMAFVGIALGVMEKVWPDVWSFGPTTLIIPLFIGAIPAFSILYSKTLYQQEAYFYQSFPVSNLEVVITKTLIPSLGLFVTMCMYSLVSFKYVLYLPIGFLVGGLLSSIAFYSISVVNMFKNSMAKKPNVFLFIMIAYFIIVFEAWLLEKIVFNGMFSDLIEIVILAVLVILQIGSFTYTNTKNMKKYYRV